MLRGAEGGPMSRVQATAQCLPVPPELVPETTGRKEGEATAELHSLVLDLGPFGFQRQVLQEKRRHHWGGDRERRLQPSPHLPKEGCAQLQKRRQVKTHVPLPDITQASADRTEG